MITINLKSFEKTYSKMDTDLKENFPKVFSLGELIAYNSEFHRGYGVTEIHNTTDKGTKFTYKKITGEDCRSSYQHKTQEIQLNLLGDSLIKEIDLYKNLEISKK